MSSWRRKLASRLSTGIPRRNREAGLLLYPAALFSSRFSSTAFRVNSRPHRQTHHRHKPLDPPGFRPWADAGYKRQSATSPHHSKFPWKPAYQRAQSLLRSPALTVRRYIPAQRATKAAEWEDRWSRKGNAGVLAVPSVTSDAVTAKRLLAGLDGTRRCLKRIAVMLAANSDVMFDPGDCAGLNLAWMACLASCHSLKKADHKRRRREWKTYMKFQGLYSVT